MATVVVMGEFRQYTGAVEEVEIEATSYRAACRELAERFPVLTPEVFAKFSVSIDGELVHEPLLETFAEDSELVFLPRIAAG